MNLTQNRLARISALGLSTLGLAVLLGVVLADGAFAQVRERERGNIAVTADVVEIDVENRKVKIKGETEDIMEYTVAESATILRGSTPIQLTEIQKGWNITVQGHHDGTSGTLTYIKVMKAPED